MPGGWQRPSPRFPLSLPPPCRACYWVAQGGLGVRLGDISGAAVPPHSAARPHPPTVCSSWRGELAGAEGQALAWVGLQQLEEYDMPPADLPLLPAVRAAMQGLL